MNPKTRPTEWAVAVAGIAGALLLYSANRDVAALATAVTAALPAIITAIVVAVRSRVTDR